MLIENIENDCSCDLLSFLFDRLFQEPVLFATSVMENIRYGRPDATDDEVSSCKFVSEIFI